MTLVLVGKGLVLRGVTFKNRGHLGSRCIYIYTHLNLFYAYSCMHASINSTR